MALFDFLKNNKTTIRCTKCGCSLKEEDAKRHNGETYCGFCHDRTLEEARARTRQTRHVIIDTPNAFGDCPQSLQQIKESMDKADTHYHANHFGDQWEVVAGINGKTSAYQLKFICKDGPGNAVALRVFSLAHFDEARRDAVYPLLQEFQDRYRFLRFTLDRDGDVKAEYDFPACSRDLGPAAMEMLLRTVQILDDVYPQLMKLAWC